MRRTEREGGAARESGREGEKGWRPHCLSLPLTCQTSGGQLQRRFRQPTISIKETRVPLALSKYGPMTPRSKTGRTGKEEGGPAQVLEEVGADIRGICHSLRSEETTKAQHGEATFAQRGPHQERLPSKGRHHYEGDVCAVDDNVVYTRTGCHHVLSRGRQACVDGP